MLEKDAFNNDGKDLIDLYTRARNEEHTTISKGRVMFTFILNTKKVKLLILKKFQK